MDKNSGECTANIKHPLNTEVGPSFYSQKELYLNRKKRGGWYKYVNSEMKTTEGAEHTPPHAISCMDYSELKMSGKGSCRKGSVSPRLFILKVQHKFPRGEGLAGSGRVELLSLEADRQLAS